MFLLLAGACASISAPYFLDGRPQPVDMPLQLGTKVVDTLVENECFYQQFHLFIISSYLNVVNYPTPKAIVVCGKRKT